MAHLNHDLIRTYFAFDMVVFFYVKLRRRHEIPEKVFDRYVVRNLNFKRIRSCMPMKLNIESERSEPFTPPSSDLRIFEFSSTRQVEVQRSSLQFSRNLK